MTSPSINAGWRNVCLYGLQSDPGIKQIEHQFAESAVRKSWTVEAEEAVRSPPQSLSAFALTPVEPDAEDPPTPSVSFTLHCKSCGGPAFEVASFPAVVGSPSPYPDLRPGDLLHRPPHRLKCLGCSKVETVFDARTDGYDGSLNGGCAYESGEVGEAFITSACSVVIEVGYGIPLSELQALADQPSSGLGVTDLFDAFVLTAIPLDGGPPFVADYECA